MPSGKTLNFAIIGCGGIACKTHLPGAGAVPDVKVAALCDSDAARSKVPENRPASPSLQRAMMTA